MRAAFDHSFALDGFQRESMQAIDDGENVLVSAPTGSGKTVVGEHAIARALQADRRAFYTTPIKALSNQKFRDLGAALGTREVGLMTGDRVVNPDASVVVMTTEVLRNMLYAGSASLEGLGWVVLDEVHFISDAYRGAVWEEVLIHTPASVRFACLSATVSNAPELGGWIESLRGPTRTVIEHRRPVELDLLYLVGDRHAEEDRLVPMLVDGGPNPRGASFDEPGDPTGGNRRSGARERGPRRRTRWRPPRRTDTVERLGDEGLLPAIYFVFSRKGCDDAAARCFREGIRLTTTEEAARIRVLMEDCTGSLADADLDTLDYDTFCEMASRGIAPHHAGMVPAFREGVERCFTEGLIKVVFATETLALGINMPARSVVVEQLSKFTGERHETLTPAQFTQLTGRAGRRGIDERGAAVVCWSPWTPFERVVALGTSREFPLESSFRPTYNMTANLVSRYSEEDAREVLGRSFAQYRSDANLVGVRSELDAAERSREETLAQLAELGVEGHEALELAELRAALARASGAGRAPGAEIEASLERLRPGDVIEGPGPGPRRLLVVVATAHRRGGTRVDAVTPRGRSLRVTSAELRSPLEPLTHVELPVPHAPRSQEFRQECAARLRRVNPKRLPGRGGDTSGSPQEREARAALESHPLHHHGEAAVVSQLARDLRRTERRIAGLRRRSTSGRSDLVKRFGSVRSVLDRFGHLDGWHLTPAGERLRSIFHECDLLTSLAIDEGLFDELEPRDCAALLSCITHEHRGSGRPPAARLPTKDLQERFGTLVALHRELAAVERASRMAPTPEPAAGFAAAARRWCEGAPLADAIGEEISGGDFVRGARNLVDLCSQVAAVTRGTTSRSMASAADLLQRDLVMDTGGEA
ncbi:MAG: DEAD/DEAH box helicase [Microthrixaceae bacterium]|nr:DEAD/DEAH box helicase [Microthrixaceae bacterium]